MEGLRERLTALETSVPPLHAQVTTCCRVNDQLQPAELERLFHSKLEQLFGVGENSKEKNTSSILLNQLSTKFVPSTEFAARAKSLQTELDQLRAGLSDEVRQQEDRLAAHVQMVVSQAREKQSTLSSVTSSGQVIGYFLPKCCRLC